MEHYKDQFPKNFNNLHKDAIIQDNLKKQTERLNKLCNNIVEAQPREWLFNEGIFLKNRLNLFTGEPGIGKSTSMRFLSYRYVTEIKRKVLFFTEEDDIKEDIHPFFIKTGLYRGRAFKGPTLF